MRSTRRTVLYTLIVVVLSLSLSASQCSSIGGMGNGGGNVGSGGSSGPGGSGSGGAGDQTSKGWKVWVRVEPCSGRFDWLSVAKEEPPGAGAGINHYVRYDTLFGPKGCIESEPFGCTYAEAKELMESLRFSDKFFNYCCKDYSVWRNIQTDKYTIVMDRPGQDPGEHLQLVKGNLCCEEAEALAGLPGACSGTRENNKQAGYLGCYKDTGTYDLDGYLVRSQQNTPERCTAICRDKGFKYAGVQYGESCLCGNSYGKYGPANNCDYKCTGDSGKICGGYNANSIYATGVGGDTGKTGGSDGSDKCTVCTQKCAKECEGVMVLLCVVSGGYKNSSPCQQCMDSCMK